MKNTDEQARKKYNRKLIKDGIKGELKNKCQNMGGSEDKELSYKEFLIKHWSVFVIGLIPVVIDFVKNGHLELETLIGAVVAIFILSLCIWGASKLKI